MRFLFLLLLITISCHAQQEKNSNNSLRFETLIGKQMPSYVLNTGKRPQLVFGFSYEHKNNNNVVPWQRILKNPTTGVSLYLTDYRTSVKGQSISLMPFIEFHPLNNHKWSAKFGMGISYFNTKFNPITNIENTYISTDLTWAIQSILYYDLLLKNNYNLRLGLGAFHHSNGHTKLPNEGLNAILLSASSSLNLKKTNYSESNLSEIKSVKKFSNTFIDIRFGNGVHDFITEEGKLKSVYTFSLKGGTFYKKIIKLGLSANYRYYQHYYDYIIKNKTANYINNPKWNASNIYLTLGAEAMLGYVGIDFEIGTNLYKPFYKKHYELQNAQSELQYTFKKTITGRLGLKWYVINTKKNPKNNLYIATHINANFGQADFTELSIGYVYCTNK